MLTPASGPIRLPVSLKHLTLMVVAPSVAMNTKFEVKNWQPPIEMCVTRSAC
jgi:hypothetical protein